MVQDGVFSGRVGLLRTLDGLLSDASGRGLTRVVLHGPAGVGKSALLARLWETRPPGSLLVLPLAALRGGWAAAALAERAGRPGPHPPPQVVAFDGHPDPEGDDREDDLAEPLAALSARSPGIVWVVVLRSDAAARALAATPGAARFELEPLGRGDAALLAAQLLEPSRLPLGPGLIARVVRLVGGRPAWLKALALGLASPDPGDGGDPVLGALVDELVGRQGRIGAACRRMLDESGFGAGELAALVRLARRGGEDPATLAAGVGLGPPRAREALARLASRGLLAEGPGGPVLADPLFGLWLRLEHLGGGAGPAAWEAVRAYDAARRREPGPASDLGARILGLALRAAGRDLPGELVGAPGRFRPGAVDLDEIPLVFDAAGEVEGVPAVLAAEARVGDGEAARLLCVPRLGRAVERPDLARLERLAALVARRTRVRTLGLWVVAPEGFGDEVRARPGSAWLTDGQALSTWVRDEHLLAA